MRNGVSIASYISVLSEFVDRPIIDKTGLTGQHYAFQWDSTELRQGVGGRHRSPCPPFPAPFRSNSVSLPEARQRSGGRSGD